MATSTAAYFIIPWGAHLGGAGLVPSPGKSLRPESQPSWLWGQGTPAGTLAPWTSVNKGSLYSEVNGTDDHSHIWMKVDEGSDAADWVEIVTDNMYVAPSGSSAINSFNLDVQDATVLSSGYAHGIHLNIGNTGAKTGGSSSTQLNAIGIDYTLKGSATSVAGFNGFYLYLMKSGTPTLTNSAIAGVNIEMTECGATDYFACIWLNKYNTTAGTAVDTWILLSNQGSGATRDGINFQSNPSTTVFKFNAAASGAVSVDTGTVPAASTYKLAVSIGGVTGYIPVHADW